MRRSIKRAWLRELRHGGHTPCYNQLMRYDPNGVGGIAYCATALLGKLAVDAGVIRLHRGPMPLFVDPAVPEFGYRGVLPPIARQWAGLRGNEEIKICLRFDMGLGSVRGFGDPPPPFRDIADFIEETIPEEEEPWNEH
jgi:hypothetical protein